MPGPLCSSKLGTNWIDLGTLSRQRTPLSAPMGLQSHYPVERITLPRDVPHRLFLAARNGLPFMAPALREQVDALLTLENCAFMAAFIAADIVFAGTGVGTVINIAAGGMAIAIIGRQGITGIKHLARFYQLASNASTREEFNIAGKAFAQGATDIGISALMSVLLIRGVRAKAQGKVTSIAGRTQIEASWFALADSIEFNIKPNEGVIFAGLTDGEVAASILKSKNPQSQIILDTAKKHGWTQERMEQDFGKEFSSTTYRLWEALSLKYQAALKGRVTAYIDATKVRLDSTLFGAAELGSMRGAGPQVELTDGKITPSVILTELEELMTSNPNVTSILLKDIKTGKSWIYTRGSKSALSH